MHMITHVCGHTHINIIRIKEKTIKIRETVDEAAYEKTIFSKIPYWLLPFCYWACVDEAPHALGKPQTGHTVLVVSVSVQRTCQ